VSAPRTLGFPGLVPGLVGKRRAVVTDAMATTHAGGRGVLTAAAMFLEMELAAQEATQPFLPDDHTTVGYEISIRHRRPTPVGESFTATAELLGWTAASSSSGSRLATRGRSSARARSAALSSAAAAWGDGVGTTPHREPNTGSA